MALTKVKGNVLDETVVKKDINGAITVNSVRVGTDNGSQIHTFEKYSAGVPTVVMRSGIANTSTNQGWKFQNRNSAGTLYDAVIISGRSDTATTTAINVETGGHIVFKGGNVKVGDTTASTSHKIVLGKYTTSTESSLPEIRQGSNGASNDLVLAATSTSGRVRLQTLSTDRLTIDSSGNAALTGDFTLSKTNAFMAFTSGNGTIRSNGDLIFHADYNNDGANNWIFKNGAGSNIITINESGVITAPQLTGNVVGNLTGNVTGNVTGNLTGNASTATNADTLDGYHASRFSSNIGYGAVSNGANFNVQCGGKGQVLILLFFKGQAAFANYGDRWCYLRTSGGGSTLVSRRMRTMEYDSRISGDSITIAYRATGYSADQTVTFNAYSSGSGSLIYIDYAYIGV